jgi:hypothetical protein
MTKKKVVSIRGAIAAVAVLATSPALAAGSIPLDWAFGNAAGCNFFLNGQADIAEMVVLTGDTFTAFRTGCDFGELVAEAGETFTIAAVCSSLGKPIPGEEVVVVRGADGTYEVTIENFGHWSGLTRCPGREEEALGV